MKKNRNIIGLAVILILSFQLSGCNIAVTKNNQIAVEEKKEIAPSDFKITENKDIYRNDELDVKKIYVTVMNKNNKWNLSDLNSFRFSETTKRQDIPYVEIRFEADRPSSTIMNTMSANAIMQPRGHSTANVIQKSFKIKLFDNTELWQGQKTINLNKHPYDLTRIRNKLSFDYIKSISNIVSLRTQFCQLFVRDLNSKNKDFVDYGLFTHVEQPNRQYLKSHGIAENAYMYKAEEFEFLRYNDKIVNVDNPLYNKNSFEEVLEINGVEEHSRLIQMLEDVNNLNLDIDDVIEKHFDRDNYITWLALNLITGNNDTNSQNFILVSPVTSTKWYFIPWDYDGAWGYDSQPGTNDKSASWKLNGISNYWGVVLHKRFFKKQKNIQDLSKKVDELAQVMSKERTEEYLKKYYEITNRYVKSEPDVKYLTSTLDDYEKEFKRISGIIEENRKRYYDGLQKPMPVFIDDPQKQAQGYMFSCSESYDFQGDDLQYVFKLSLDPGFTKIIAERKTSDTYVVIDGLKPGRYYCKVEIFDSKGNNQIAFDVFNDRLGILYDGIREFDLK